MDCAIATAVIKLRLDVNFATRSLRHRNKSTYLRYGRASIDSNPRLSARDRAGREDHHRNQSRTSEHPRARLRRHLHPHRRPTHLAFGRSRRADRNGQSPRNRCRRAVVGDRRPYRVEATCLRRLPGRPRTRWRCAPTGIRHRGAGGPLLRIDSPTQQQRRQHGTVRHVCGSTERRYRLANDAGHASRALGSYRGAATSVDSGERSAPRSTARHSFSWTTVDYVDKKISITHTVKFRDVPGPNT